MSLFTAKGLRFEIDDIDLIPVNAIKPLTGGDGFYARGEEAPPCEEIEDLLLNGWIKNDKEYRH